MAQKNDISMETVSLNRDAYNTDEIIKWYTNGFIDDGDVNIQGDKVL